MLKLTRVTRALAIAIDAVGRLFVGSPVEGVGALGRATAIEICERAVLLIYSLN
jgi:hypothetical protein